MHCGLRGAAGEVGDILKDLDDQFHSKFKNREPTVHEKNEYIREKNRVIELNKKSGDTTNIYTEIGTNLGAYFDNFYKCMAVLEEEERRSKNEVYTGGDSLGKRALQRVLLKKQLEAMSKELREIMVYQSPPELGALWTEVEAMMKVMGKEQAGAIAAQMQRQRYDALKKQRRIEHIKCHAWKYGIATFCMIYGIWLIWAILQIRIEEKPELGICLLPKGTWPYHYYQNLKWIDCEQNLNKGK